MLKLIEISTDMDKPEYDMYQDIPNNEIGSTNIIYGKDYKFFKDYLNKCIYDKTNIDKSLMFTKTIKYIFYKDNYPIGEIGIRTTLNDFWINKGSQIFYKIRQSERNKGYGTEMLKLALEKCKEMGFKQVRINCDDSNISSKNVILKNGGQIDIKSYKTENGLSSSYIIIL